MIHYLYLIFLISLGVSLEVIFRSFGLFLPFTAFAVFYAGCARGLVPCAVFAGIAGFILDSLFGYTVPVSCLLLLLILPIVWGLKDQYVEADSFLIQMGIGALLVILITLPSIPFRAGWSVTLELLPSLFLASVFSALLLPFYIYIADRIATALALGTYSTGLLKKRGS